MRQGGQPAALLIASYRHKPIPGIAISSNSDDIGIESPSRVADRTAAVLLQMISRLAHVQWPVVLLELPGVKASGRLE
jgi:hypothetical protein